MHYTINERELSIGGNKLSFDYPIDDILGISEMLIIRLEPSSGIIYNENVFGVSLIEKNIKWQITKMKYHERDCPYTGMILIKNQLRLFNWCSFYLDVNPVTGEVMERVDSK